MKTIIPLNSSVKIIDKKLKENEISLVLKDFLHLNSLKIDFKEVGFKIETVKDSVFFKSFIIQELKQKYLHWLFFNNLYNFFFFSSNFFFLSKFLNFKDFYSFFFFYFFLLCNKNLNIFITFSLTNKLIFFIKNCELSFKQLAQIVKKLNNNFLIFNNIELFELNFLNYKKFNSILIYNYSFFSVWFYFFSSLRGFYNYFILKFHLYFLLQLYFFNNVNLISIIQEKKNL